MSYTDMAELVGRKISKVLLDSNAQEVLGFETDEGAIYYEAEGDCCSESWFADIVNFPALDCATVSSVEALHLPQDPKDGRSRQEYDVVYGYLIRTDRGAATVIFRNSSNGYYGGWLERVEKPNDDTDMKELKGDYPE